MHNIPQGQTASNLCRAQGVSCSFEFLLSDPAVAYNQAEVLEYAICCHVGQNAILSVRQ